MPGGLYTPIDAYNDKLKLDNSLQSSQIENLLNSVKAASGLRDFEESNALRKEIAASVGADGQPDWDAVKSAFYRHGQPENALKITAQVQQQKALEGAQNWLNSYSKPQQPTQALQQDQSRPQGAFDLNQPGFSSDAQKLIDAERKGTISQEGKQVLDAMRNQVSTQAQPQQQAPSGPYGLPMPALSMMMSGMPGLEKVGSAMVEANKPVVMREGAGAIRYDANGNAQQVAFSPKLGEGMTQNPDGSVSSPQGYLQTLQQILQTKQAVENRNTLTEGRSPTGAPILRTKQQGIDLANQVPSLPQINPINQNSVSEQLGGSPPNISPAPLPGGGFLNGPSTETTSASEERGKNIAEMEQKINDTASLSLDKLARNNKMIDLLPTIEAGPLASKVTAFKNLMNELGLPVIGKDPTNNQEFEKYAYQNAITAGKQAFGARVTNLEVDTLIKSNPGSTLTQQASKALIEFDNMIQQRNLDKSNAFYSYKQNGGDPARFNLWFNQNYPMAGLTAPKDGQSASQSAPSSQGNISIPANRIVGQTYNTPKGKMKWTGTGWLPAN